MGHLALLAQQSGIKVSGSDSKIYTPMDAVLKAHNIQMIEGWDLAGLKPQPDLFVLGNTGLKRGHPAVEYLLKNNLRFMSGAQWLGQEVLTDRWVLAVAGTHGKTTTTAMLAWILHQAGCAPGFLVGGVMQNMKSSASLGEQPFFVLEADEYDTSCFDRRAKFLHYRPRTLIIGNLEYDHADIYPDLAAIQQQFQWLLRLLPENGLLITPAEAAAIEAVIDRGLWSPRAFMGIRGVRTKTAPLWQVETDQKGFTVYLDDKPASQVRWCLRGKYNALNGLAAIIAAHHAGVAVETAANALCSFRGVKRRLEQIGRWGQLTLYDDFAHHPTAISSVLETLRADFPDDRIIAFIDPGSHTMARGDLASRFADSTQSADLAVWYQNDKIQWSTEALVAEAPRRIEATKDLPALAKRACRWMQSDRPVHLVCMSNQSSEHLTGQIAQLCRQTAE